MENFEVKNFKKGWIIGNFEPSLLKTFYFESALKEYKANDEEPAHYHAVATEWTIVVSGKIQMNDSIFEENKIIEIRPNEVVKFKAITDAKTMVIKVPSVENDKYLVE